MISFFIPIRKNSKRITNKNTREIGKYKFGLTEIKIKQLKKFQNLVKNDKLLKNFEYEFVISSDDIKIKNFVKKV